MSYTFQDPDLEEVLVDLHNDPKAHLFAVKPEKLLAGLRDGSLHAQLPRRRRARELHQMLGTDRRRARASRRMWRPGHRRIQPLVICRFLRRPQRGRRLDELARSLIAR